MQYSRELQPMIAELEGNAVLLPGSSKVVGVVDRGHLGTGSELDSEEKVKNQRPISLYVAFTKTSRLSCCH